MLCSVRNFYCNNFMKTNVPTSVDCSITVLLNISEVRSVIAYFKQKAHLSFCLPLILIMTNPLLFHVQKFCAKLKSFS